MKRARKGGGEQDVFSRWWRHHLIWTGRPGMTKFYKRKANKRFRREGKPTKETE